jgi:hypothetical protein
MKDVFDIIWTLKTSIFQVSILRQKKGRGWGKVPIFFHNQKKTELISEPCFFMEEKRREGMILGFINRYVHACKFSKNGSQPIFAACGTRI